MGQESRHLEFRAGHWHYNRRVPARYAAFDDRGRIRISLKTTSFEIAKERRDAMVKADDLYWASLCGCDDTETSVNSIHAQRAIAQRRYSAASNRAVARGYTYVPAEELAKTAAIEELIERIHLVDMKDTGTKSKRQEAEAEALLGGAKPPPVNISEAFDIYCEQIAADELIGKSDVQRKSWVKTQKRGVHYLIDLIGDKPILSITRQDAQAFYNWWRERIEPKTGKPALKANTANRDIGCVRKLYSAYTAFIGEEDRPNPFRNLAFKDKGKGEVPPFENDWVRSRILAPDALATMNEQARLIVLALIETGCRPSEIANLESEDIVLDHAVPHIRIQPKPHREIKTRASIRDIPLVGVSFKAMRQAPNGFERYRDKPNLLSATLMKAFKSRGLFPTPHHRIYSFRHSFEKRMLEAGIDRDLRMTLMGHANSRPEYGDGGSLEFRRDQLLKISHSKAG